MRKVLLASIVLCVAFTSFLGVAFAFELDNEVRSENNCNVNVTLSIQGSTASLDAFVMGNIGITQTKVDLYLQQYKNGRWTNYREWSSSENGASCFVSKTVSVPKGYKYRAKASCYAYAGSSYENVTKYSGEVSS